MPERAAEGKDAEAAAQAAKRRTPHVVRHRERAIRKPPLFVRPDRIAPFLDDVDVVGAVAEIERAAMVRIAALHVIVPLIVIERADRRVLGDALAARQVVRVVRRRGDPIGGAGRARQSANNDCDDDRQQRTHEFHANSQPPCRYCCLGRSTWSSSLAPSQTYLCPWGNFGNLPVRPRGSRNCALSSSKSFGALSAETRQRS